MIKTGIIYETLGSVSNMQVVESNNPNEVRLSGVFGVCGIRNDNHRVYEKANYAKCLEALQTKIANNNCLGELEHPNTFNINLDNVSHIIEAIKMNEDGTVTGTVKLLNTPKGQIAKAIVEGGAPLFISSRAAGSVDSKGNVTLQSIVTYDLVGTPGFSQAKLTAENKKFECLNESLENPCWMIVESETPEDNETSQDDETATKAEDELKLKEENVTKPEGKETDDESSFEKSKEENKDNNDNEVTMEDLKKSIEELTQKVTQLEAQLHIAQESFEPVEYDKIEGWIREEFAPELRDSINECVAEGVERWVMEEITPKIDSWITEEFAGNVQSWVVEHFADAVQNWITEEYSGTVQDWVAEEYSGAVQKWVNEEYSSTLQKWITEHFAGSIDEWVNETLMPHYKTAITEEINSNLSEYLKSKNVSENKYASIDAVLEKLSEKAERLTKEDAKTVINETSTSKFKGVFVVENMPLQYRPMFEALDEKRQEEIICSARMYDFTKPNALESFWANQDLNATVINETRNEDVVSNPAANNVITSMRKMLHI